VQMFVKKTTNVAAILLCLAGSLGMTGCAVYPERSKSAAKQVLVINLSDKPQYQQLLTGKPQTCGMRSGRVYLLPGQSIGQHNTNNHEELIIFLAGKGVTLIGPEQKPYQVSAGKAVYIPPYTEHNNQNTGSEPLIYIYCVAPVSYTLPPDPNHL